MDEPTVIPTDLSPLQKEIIWWIGRKLGLVAPYESDYGRTQKMMDTLNAMQERLRLAREGLHPPISIATPAFYGAPWSSARFDGQPVTARRSVTLAKSLKRLEARGLVKRTRSRGKRSRTSHVNLTKDGLTTLFSLVAQEYGGFITDAGQRLIIKADG